MGNIIEPMSHVDRNCTDEYEMDGTRLGLCVLEMTISAIVLGSSVLFGKLMLSITSFSTTMKVLFLNMLFAAFGIAFTRLFILVPQYISINQLYDVQITAPVQIFHDVCINVNTLIVGAITLECMIYSFRPNPKRSTTIILCSVNTFWPWFTTISFYWLEQHGFVDTVPEFIALEVFNLISWAIFLRLYFFNRKRYKTAGGISLEEKYEITVKIRVLRTLLFLAALTTLRNFLTMTLLIIIITYVVPQCLYYVHLYCNHAYDLTVAFYSLLFILPLIVSHNEFQKQFKKFVFGHSKQPSGIPSIAIIGDQRPDQLRNALGEALIVSNSTNTYYQQLAASWNQMPQGTSDAQRQQSLTGRHQANKAKVKMATLKVRELLVWRKGKVHDDDEHQSPGMDRRHSHLERRSSRMADVEVPANYSARSLRRSTSPQPMNVQRIGGIVQQVTTTSM